MKNTAIDIDYSDLSHGKYDESITVFIDVHMSELGFGDEDETDGMGNGSIRYGRRVYSWDEQGFQETRTFRTVDDAVSWFADYRETFYGECEKCGEKVHNDHESWFEHEKECEPTRAQWEAAGKDATLGVGHVWTNVSCRAYRTLNPHDCACRGGLLDEFKQAEAQLARNE